MNGEEGEKAFLPHSYLNASINIARRVIKGMGWGRGEPPEPANEAKGEKPQLNAGSLVLQEGVAHIETPILSVHKFFLLN